MSNSLTRVVGAGRTFLSPLDIFIQANTNDGGQVEIVLPNTQLIFTDPNNSNTPYNYIGVRFIDISNNASVNNIVIYAFDGDKVNGNQTLTVNTNGAGGIITLIGQGQWSFEQNSSPVITSIIEQGSGTNSSYRINSGNTASGSYSTALGKSNTVDSNSGFINGECNTALGYFSNNIFGGYCNVSGKPSFTFPNNCVTNSGLYFNTFSVYSNVASLANDGSSITLVGDFSSCSAYVPAVANNILASYNYGACYANAKNGVCGSTLTCVTYDGVNTTFCYNPPIPLPFVSRGNPSSIIIDGCFNSNLGESSTIINGRCNTIDDCGFYNSISNGYCNSVINSYTYYSDIKNGACNTISSASLSNILNGNNNIVSGNKSTVLNGSTNTASNIYSLVLNGKNNTSSSRYSVVVNGCCNTVSAYHSAILGGFRNTASNTYSIAINGKCNTASGYSSAILNGFKNIASSASAVILNGAENTASNIWTNVLNGVFNSSTQRFSSVINGCCNIASGCRSFIAGGLCNNTCANADSFILGSCICADRVCTTFVNNLSIKNIPTSSAGLPSKSIWYDSASCNLKIVP